MTMTSSPPMRTSPIVMTVFSGLNVRLASLYGSVIRSTSCTPSSTSSSRGSPCAIAADRADHGPQRARRAVHVESHLHELRDHALDLLVGRAFLHDHNHDVPASCYRHRSPPALRDRLVTAPRGRCVSPPTAGLPLCRRRPSIVMGRLRDPLEPPRLVDDALEQPRDRVVVERAPVRRAWTCVEHLPLAVGLVDLQAERVLDLADLQRARRALVQQARRAARRARRCGSRSRRSSRAVRRSARVPFSHRTYPLDARRRDRRHRPRSRRPAHERAADDRRIGDPADVCGHVLGPRDPEAERDRQRRVRPHARRPARRTSSASRVARAGDAQPRDDVQEPAAELRRPRAIRSSVVVGLRRKIGSSPAATQGGRERRRPPRAADRAPARRPRRRSAARVGERLQPHAHDRVRVGEQDDRRRRRRDRIAPPGRARPAASRRRAARVRSRAGSPGRRPADPRTARRPRCTSAPARSTARRTSADRSAGRGRRPSRRSPAPSGCLRRKRGEGVSDPRHAHAPPTARPRAASARVTDLHVLVAASGQVHEHDGLPARAPARASAGARPRAPTRAPAGCLRRGRATGRPRAPASSSDVDVLGPPPRVQPGVLRSDRRVVEPGRDRVRAARCCPPRPAAPRCACPAGRPGCRRRIARRAGPARCLRPPASTPIRRTSGIVDERVEDAHGVAAAADAGQRRRRAGGRAGRGTARAPPRR